ncbi:cytochrome P450 [Rhodococcus sp. Eu-32]|uniref:cytochrome P450 family protein n=1 Tax=Rhodococcus sp. Eu-32 TaxID=1017319 RepID=UPI001402B9B5|nr:cytochrome P450 [Rhodococcus sp. Eu-32]
MTFDKTFFQDPQPLYSELRAHGPVHRFTSPTGVSGWMVTDYDLARQALNNRNFVKTQDTMAGAAPGGESGSISARMRSWLRKQTAPWMVSHMLAAEPPDHTRLRAVVQNSFTPATLRSLRPTIETYADQLVAQARARAHGGRPFDLVEAFAFPLPVQVICHILGVPDEHHRAIGECSRVLSDVIVADPDDLRRAALTLARIIYPLLRQRRRRPEDDLLSVLMEARERGEMTLREVMSTVALLLIAGHETTVNLIANTTYTLLSNRERFEQLVAGTVKLNSTIEESLRYEPSLPTTTLRQALSDVAFGGVQMSKGDVVMISLAAANRDDAKFPNPTEFDPARATRGHLAFGYGIHHCIGAPLARMEGEIALMRLVDAFPTLHLASHAPVWRESIVFRGLESLMVEVH